MVISFELRVESSTQRFIMKPVNFPIFYGSKFNKDYRHDFSVFTTTVYILYNEYSCKVKSCKMSIAFSHIFLLIRRKLSSFFYTAFLKPETNHVRKYCDKLILVVY